jgi:uncharacterized protein YecE (DUF72 family)
VKRRASQGSLFGDPPGGERIGPAEISDELRIMASELPRGLRLGTSSWSFPGWRGVVFDREATEARLAREGLEAYARHPLLRAVGIDRTYYAPISEEAFAAYAAQVPDDFRFLTKAPNAVTAPNPGFLDARLASEIIVEPWRAGLGAKAGPLLFQFPPLGSRFRKDPASFTGPLGEFLTRLPAGPWYAVELRDRELLTAEYAQALLGARAGHCVCVHPRMPAPREQVDRVGDPARSGPLVVRWMLGGGLDYEEARDRYAPFDRLVDEDLDTREQLAELVTERLRAGMESVVIANNKAEGSAPWTVFRLAERVAHRLGHRVS